MSRKTLRAARKVDKKSSTAKKSLRRMEASNTDPVETSREDVPKPIQEETAKEVSSGKGNPAAVETNHRRPSLEFESLPLSKVTPEVKQGLTPENTKAVDRMFILQPSCLSPHKVVDCRTYGSKQVTIAGGFVGNNCEENSDTPSGVVDQARIDYDIVIAEGFNNRRKCTEKSEDVRYKKALSDILPSNKHAGAQIKEMYRSTSLCSFDGLHALESLSHNNGASHGRVQQLPGTPPPSIKETRQAQTPIEDAETDVSKDQSQTADLLRKREREDTVRQRDWSEQGKLKKQQESRKHCGPSTLPPEQGPPFFWPFTASQRQRSEMEMAAAYKNQRKPNIRKRTVKDGNAIKRSPPSTTADISSAREPATSANIQGVTSGEPTAIACSASGTSLLRHPAGLSPNDTGGSSRIIEAIQSTLVSIRELKAEALPKRIESWKRGKTDCKQQQNKTVSRGGSIVARSDDGDQENSHAQSTASIHRTDIDPLSITSQEQNAGLAAQTPRNAATHLHDSFINNQQWRRLKKASTVDESGNKRGFPGGEDPPRPTELNSSELSSPSFIFNHNHQPYLGSLRPQIESPRQRIYTRQRAQNMSALRPAHASRGSSRANSSSRAFTSPSSEVDAIADFNAKATPAPSRNTRGFQPSEVNRSKTKKDCEVTNVNTQSRNVAHASMKKNPETLASASTTLSRTSNRTTSADQARASRTREVTESARHHTVHMSKDDSSKSRVSRFKTQSGSMEPELGAVNSPHSDNASVADTSSVEIITHKDERQPSCWSRAAATEPQKRPTWDDSCQVIDRLERDIPRTDRSQNKSQRPSINNVNRRQSLFSQSKSSQTISSNLGRQLANYGVYTEKRTIKKGSMENKDVSPSDVTPLRPSQANRPLHSAEDTTLAKREVVANTPLTVRSPNLHNVQKGESNVYTTGPPHLRKSRMLSTLTEDRKPKVHLPVHLENARNGPANTMPHANEDAGKGHQTREAMRSNARPPHLRNPTPHKSDVPEKTQPVVNLPGPKSQSTKAAVEDESKKPPDISQPEGLVKRKFSQDNAKDDEDGRTKALPPHLRAKPVKADSIVPVTKGTTESNAEQIVPSTETLTAPDCVNRLTIDDCTMATQDVSASRASTKLDVPQNGNGRLVDINEDTIDAPGQRSSVQKGRKSEWEMNGNGRPAYKNEDTIDIPKHKSSKNKGKKSEWETNGNGHPADNNDHTTDMPKHRSSKKKGKKSEWEINDYEPRLADWEGNWQPAPVGDEWTIRDPFDITFKERSSVIQAWKSEVAESASIPAEVDTENPDFRTGAGIVNGDLDLQRAIEASITLPSNDDYTLLKRNQTAQDAIEDREALALRLGTIPENKSRNTKNGMTREERREYRRQLIEDQRNYVPLPNPHAPDANIYMRPAEGKDLRQITEIYNHYTRTSVFTPFTEELNQTYWHDRLNEIKAESLPFIVAILMADKASRNFKDVRRLKQERVVGFANAVDFGSRSNAFRYTVELDIWVDPGHLKKGIGKTLLDRMITVMCPQYSFKDAAPFLCESDYYNWMGGGVRAIKTIMFSMLYSAKEEEEVKWKKQWLEKWDFTPGGVIEKIGYKFDRPIKVCQYYYTTWADIPTK